MGYFLLTNFFFVMLTFDGATNFTPNCHFKSFIQASYLILSNCHFFSATTIEIKSFELVFTSVREFVLFTETMTSEDSFSEDLIPRILPQPTLHPVLVS